MQLAALPFNLPLAGACQCLRASCHNHLDGTAGPTLNSTDSSIYCPPLLCRDQPPTQFDLRPQSLTRRHRAIPFVGEFALIGRIVRLFRLLQMVSGTEKLRQIAATLVRAVPSVLYILVLMIITGYMHAVAGYHFFHSHDPFHWGSLQASILTLFGVISF